MKKIPEMIAALVLCVCFVLLCGIAGAEEIHVLGSGNWDDLDYQFTLPDGRILVVYDFERTKEQAILVAEFTEADVLAGRDVSGKVRLRRRVNAPQPH